MITRQDIIALFHTIIMVGAWLSPFWLDWKIVFIVLAIYELQVFVFRGCVLTNLQFEKNVKTESNMTMTAYWYERFGHKLTKAEKAKLRINSKYTMPLLILLVTTLGQLILKIHVFISI